MLEIINLTKKYDDKTIFEDFSYSFDTGIYLIKGKSGIGKTTLLKIIAGIDTDFYGEIKNGGLQNCSMAFQEYRLIPQINALNNLLCIFDSPAQEDIDSCTDLLFRLGFTSEEMRLYPDEMSGGMKQRVSLARALLKPSSILLLDEPTRELNVELITTLLEILEVEGKHKTVIISTHDNLECKLSCKEVLVL